MHKYISILFAVIVLGLSTPVLANPGLLWGLVHEASQTGPGSDKWKLIADWLETDQTEDIDWSPAGEESTRVLLQRHNPALYNRFFANNEVDDDHYALLTQIIPQPRPFIGMQAYESTAEDLGAGFAGTVFKAIHRLSKAHVAVKTLDRAQYKQHGLEFPPLEATLLSRLRHPNIVRFYHAISTDTAMLLIMEALSGCELFEVARRGPMPEADCKPIMRQILQGVQYMHRQNICHRDLKLENVMIDDGNIKIIDLGLASFFDPTGATLLTDFCGSPEYAAPEVYAQHPYFGPDVDVWAIGAILYTLATDFTPFDPVEDATTLSYMWPDDVELSYDFRAFIAGIFQFASERCKLAGLIEHKWLKDTN